MARIIVSFGGRHLPMKFSEYTLDFKRKYEIPPNNMIVEKKENRLSKDIQDEKGMNKQKVIDNFMKSGENIE